MPISSSAPSGRAPSWAALGNHADTARVLIAHGAKVDVADALGMTPLHYAASIDYGDTDVVDTFVAAAPRLGVRNKSGKTARDLARSYRHAALARAFVPQPTARR